MEVTNHGEYFMAMGDDAWSFVVVQTFSHDCSRNVNLATLARQNGG